nr:Chain B, VAL-SER-LEU-ALA-ARG-ARG-PRO-LEU-PRO-PRO-LEU-PRO [unidentified]4EIK_B Chain B, VSL12 peptide [synthetic construct]4RTZ_B Chain B, VSL12 peptide [synthetic construct]7A2Z_B Chain B, VSL12 [synthetic construct]7PVT_B Chain B, VSL12 [unidentified]7PVT_D Chain D, VSL12 [unidentified]7PVX_B Chain B, VSL12 peptide [synthetic construct]7PVX_D Chain D, VSL12 peptide [synthetic construct]8BQ3_B Chain B, PRO-LEU-PRO [synthetic construct]
VSLARRPLPPLP